jgi:hypothetical protein
MNLFGLTPDSAVERIRQAGGGHTAPSMVKSMLLAGVGFCGASLWVFATVAFAERWMYQNLGLSGAYAVWTALFILLGGGALSLVVIGPGRLSRFYLLFSAAFLMYAIGWVSAYFILRNAAGEWGGSIAGSLLMAFVIALGFGAARSAPVIAATLFIFNSAGYFLGSALYNAIHGKNGMMMWGMVYGLLLGAGLGAAIYLAQSPTRALLHAKRF